MFGNEPITIPKWILLIVIGILVFALVLGLIVICTCQKRRRVIKDEEVEMNKPKKNKVEINKPKKNEIAVAVAQRKTPKKE